MMHLFFRQTPNYRTERPCHRVVTAGDQTNWQKKKMKDWSHTHARAHDDHGFAVLMRRSEKPVFGKNVAPCRASTGPSGTLRAHRNTEVSLCVLYVCPVSLNAAVKHLGCEAVWRRGRECHRSTSSLSEQPPLGLGTWNIYTSVL